MPGRPPGSPWPTLTPASAWIWHLMKNVLHFQMKAVNGDCVPRYDLRNVSATGGKTMAISRKVPLEIPAPFQNISLSQDRQRALLKTLRQQIVERFRPVIMTGSGPTRVMA